MLQQLVTTRPTFTNFACEALDQLRDLVRDSQSHKCTPTYHEFELVISYFISWYHKFNSSHHEWNSWYVHIM